MNSEQSKMPGCTVTNQASATAHSSRLNDRLRRNAKRADREQFKLDVRSGQHIIKN